MINAKNNRGFSHSLRMQALSDDQLQDALWAYARFWQAKRLETPPAALLQAAAAQAADRLPRLPADAVTG